MYPYKVFIFTKNLRSLPFFPVFGTTARIFLIFQYKGNVYVMARIYFPKPPYTEKAHVAAGGPFCGLRFFRQRSQF